MYQKLEECPVCKHTHFTNDIICEDYSQSNESFVIVKCEHCELRFTNPRPDENNIAQYYQHDDYISHTNKANNLVNLVYKLARYYTLRQKAKLIKGHVQGKQLLDFGCGTGVFLNHMHALNYQIQGYEPSEQAREIALKSGNFPVHQNLTQIQKEQYDVITAWHVFEHVHELKATLRALRKTLKPDGIILAAVPNISSYDAHHYKEHWAAYDVPRHLYHFNQNAFQSLATSCKLKIKEVYPMKLDSYYVSLLSEQHKGTTASLKKLINGYLKGRKSNLKASQTGEYSSLIYVLTK
ncbi:MAG: class I SAM-dependent methyltransferase [Cyclobacteriaceae bacterium]